MKMVGLFNVVFYGSVIGATLLVMHGSLRLTFVGIICAALTIGMYASPLAAMVIIILTLCYSVYIFMLVKMSRSVDLLKLYIIMTYKKTKSILIFFLIFIDKLNIYIKVS